VTKAGEPLLSEAVLVSDDSPNEGRIADYRRAAFNITYREYCSETLPRSGAGRQDKLSVKQLLQREHLEIFWYANCAVPSHISRAQVADITKDHPAMNAVRAILVRLYPIGFDAHIGALENFSVTDLLSGKALRQFDLTPTNPNQTTRYYDKESGEDGKNQGIEGDRIIRRPLPKGFVWLCLGGSIVGMLLGLCYLWALGLFSSEQKHRHQKDDRPHPSTSLKYPPV
jgi:hypothetical protein